MKNNLLTIPSQRKLPLRSNSLPQFIMRVIDAFIRKLDLSQTLDLSILLSDEQVHIVDVGAKAGFAERWHQLGQNMRIVLFEPNRAGFDELINQYKHDGRVTVHNTALSEDGGKLSINVAAFPDASSVFQHDATFFSRLNFRDFCRDVDVVECESKTLRDFFDNKINPIDFIKLDVEGYELAILRGSGDLISSCVGIETEVSYVKWSQDLPLFGDVDLYCRQNGFVLVQLSPPAHYHYLLPNKLLESHGIIFSGDALYFRTPFDIVELAKNGLWDIMKVKKAICLYLVYGNFEFAYVLLENAISATILSKADPFIRDAYEMVAKRSRFNRLISLGTLRKVRQLLRIRRSDGLDFDG